MNRNTPNDHQAAMQDAICEILEQNPDPESLRRIANRLHFIADSLEIVATGETTAATLRQRSAKWRSGERRRTFTAN
jgi:hypothetical protein